MWPQLLSKTHDNINFLFTKTENSIRELTKEAMDKEYGTDWETYSRVFDPELREELSKRQAEFEKSYGLSQTSRLVDFAKFSEVLKIILQNKAVFDKIFSQSPKSYDLLTRMVHLSQKDFQTLTEKGHNEIIAISWLLLKQIQNWYAGESSRVLWYTVDLAFDSENKDENKKAKDWFSRVKTKAEKIEEVMHPNLGRVYRLDYQKGSVFLTNPITSEIPLGKKWIYSSRIRVMSKTTELLDLVLSLGGHSYWNISWTLRDGLNLRSFVNAINLLQANSENIPDDNFTTWGGAEYTLSEKPQVLFNVIPIKDNKFRIRLVKKNSHFDNGFFGAHKFFSPQLIYEMALGLRTENEKKQIISSSLTK